MRTSIAAVLIAGFMVGCATPEQQAAQAEREAARMMQVYGPACEKLGFKSNTDPWRQCIIGLSQRDLNYRYSNNTFYGPPYWGYPY
jgi:hypothetical protein